MPFFTYRDEAGLDDLLLPQPGWACVIFQDLPVVYLDKKWLRGMVSTRNGMGLCTMRRL
jgi:hypothetical protein